MIAEADRNPEEQLLVAYLTSQYPATSHTFISREVAALRELGVNVDTFSIRPPTPAELTDDRLSAEAHNSFTVLKQPATSFVAAHLGTLVTHPAAYFRTLGMALSHRPPGLRGFGLSLAHFAEAILLAGELKRRRSTRLHNHFANSAATVGLLASSLLGLPWSFTMHGISETDYPAGILLGRKIEAAEFVICVSYFGRAQAMRLVPPEHWSKLHIIRCGLKLDKLPVRAENLLGVRIISVGRLSPEKGQAGLLKAFAALAPNYPQLELTLVGDGPESDRLRATAEKLGISDRVRFAGRLGEQASLEEIAKADILAVASFIEGLPIVLMEAMAMGTAVVATRVAGIPELVEDGKTGLLFTPSNWNELTDRIRCLLDDRSLRERLSSRAREKVAEEFDIRRSANHLQRLFSEGSRDAKSSRAIARF
jgi:glycosyltransferase involved in cell wall biosynthesis